MSQDHNCFRKFISSLNAESSRETYGYKIQKFMKFAVSKNLINHTEDFEALLEFDTEKITDVLEEYVFFMQERGDIAVSTDLASPELFFEMNRKIWHNKLVRKGIRRLQRKKGGELPITDKELQTVYFNAKSPRDKCLISVLSSLGIRPGAFTDPVLKFKHLVPIEESYCVKIYDESDEGYWGILIPEARKDVDIYKQSRINAGEIITDESPLIATLPSRWNAKRNYMTSNNLKEILLRLITGKVKRVKTGNRYDKALTYMFRKRFNTKLKLNNDVNSNIAEKVMAHKRGLDGTYLKPTMQECYNEVKKAIPELTIDSTQRQKLEIQKNQEEITTLQEEKKLREDTESDNISLKKRLDEMESNMKIVLLRSNWEKSPARTREMQEHLNKESEK